MGRENLCVSYYTESTVLLTELFALSRNPQGCIPHAKKVVSICLAAQGPPHPLQSSKSLWDYIRLAHPISQASIDNALPQRAHLLHPYHPLQRAQL